MTTRALELADRLTAVAEHLRKHPHLQNVFVDDRSPHADIYLQISAFKHLHEPGGVYALLMWAKSFNSPTITVRWHDKENLITTVAVTARLGDFSVEVWDTDDGDLHRWRTGGRYARTQITVDQLAAYVAAGTVEHADEHMAVTS